VLRELATLGIDYNDVVQVLEDQSVSTSEASWYHRDDLCASFRCPER
jgi:hypothetical protein